MYNIHIICVVRRVTKINLGAKEVHTRRQLLLRIILKGPYTTWFLAHLMLTWSDLVKSNACTYNHQVADTNGTSQSDISVLIAKQEIII